jgi:hypothetical protein
MPQRVAPPVLCAMLLTGVYAGAPQLPTKRTVPISLHSRIKGKLMNRKASPITDDDGDEFVVHTPRGSNASVDSPELFTDDGQVYTELTELDLERLRHKWKLFKKAKNFVVNTARKVGSAVGLPVKPPSPGGATSDPDFITPEPCVGSWKTVIPEKNGKQLSIYAIEKAERGSGATCPVANGQLQWGGVPNAQCVWGTRQKAECVNCEPGIIDWYVKSKEGPGGTPCDKVLMRPPKDKNKEVLFENKENPCPCSKDCVGYWNMIQEPKPCEPGIKQWKVVQRKAGTGKDCQDDRGDFPVEDEKREVSIGCNKPCEEEFSVTDCELKDSMFCKPYAPWFCKYLQTATYKVISPARGSGRACTFVEPTTEFIRECPKCQVEGTCDPKDDIGFIGAAAQKVSGLKDSAKKWFKNTFR